MESIFKNEQTNPIFDGGFLKSLSHRGEEALAEVFQFILPLRIPCIHVLAHHDAVEADVPHHGGTMATGFQMVIDLLPLVGAFDGSTPFVNGLPLVGRPSDFGEQARIVLGMRVVRSSVLGSGTSARGRTSPLLAVLGLIVSVMVHLPAVRTNGDALRRDFDSAARGVILLATLVQVDDRLLVLHVD